MRIAESLNNTKKRIMDAFDRGDREMVAELTDYLAYMVMENVAIQNVTNTALQKITDTDEYGMVMKIRDAFGDLAKFLEVTEREKAKIMEGYKFEEEAEE